MMATMSVAKCDPELYNFLIMVMVVVTVAVVASLLTVRLQQIMHILKELCRFERTVSYCSVPPSRLYRSRMFA